MREILAVVDITGHSGQWHTMEVRLPFMTPKSRVEEFAVAKAKAEMGTSARWYLFNLHNWETVEADESCLTSMDI